MAFLAFILSVLFTLIITISWAYVGQYLSAHKVWTKAWIDLSLTAKLLIIYLFVTFVIFVVFLFPNLTLKKEEAETLEQIQN